jgi:hypothetical protein
MAAILYLAMVVLAFWIRYNMQMSQACLYVGREISDTGSKTGFQDAITPPESTKITILVWVLTLIDVVCGFVLKGVITGVALVAELFVLSTITGLVILPKPQSDFWIKRIYASLAKRTADYARDNDMMRSNATRMLAARIEERMPGKLVD